MKHIVFSAMLLPFSNQALGAYVYLGGAGSVVHDRVEQREGGDPTRVGGYLFNLGLIENFKMGGYRFPIDFRFQFIRDKTGWERQVTTNAPKFRDGYDLEGSEIAIGPRLFMDEAQTIFVTLLLGYGKSDIQYEYRMVDSKEVNELQKASISHFSLTADFSWFPPSLAIGNKLNFGIHSVLRAASFEKHVLLGETKPTTASLNIPSVPIPTLGLSIRFKI